MATPDKFRPSASTAGAAVPPKDAWVPKRKDDAPHLNQPKYQLWLEPMEELWDSQKKSEILQLFRDGLRSTDPRGQHSFVLDLLDHSADLRKRKPDTLGFLLLGEFDRWLRINTLDEKEILKILTNEVRMRAFHLAASSNSNVFDLLTRLYRLTEPDNSFLVSRVKVMLARQQFKEAATAVTKVNLHDHFSLEDICLPLIFQDKANMVEKYMQGRPPLQEELIRKLDSFCEKGFDINSYLSDLPTSIPGVRIERLRRRNLTKMITRLVKMFKLDMSLCPNTAKSKDLGAVKYLLHKRYIEESMAQDVWDELVVSTIGDNASVQVELIEHLVCYNDLPAAVRWARHYGIDAAQLPQAVVEELQRSEQTDGPCYVEERVEENWEEELQAVPSTSYYNLNLPDDRVFLISTTAGLQRCLQDITQEPNTMVGIDMEWRPSFTPTQKSKVALCQIATHTTAYLLDMPALCVPENADTVKAFFTELLQSEDILKLGFEISGDYRMLGQSFPELQEAVKGERRTVNVQGVAKQILAKVPDRRGVKGNSLGLTDLVYFCFGKYLDKRDRISDWERRPLRPAQITYAALDAFCLLEVFDHLKELVLTEGLDIVMEQCMSANPNKKSKPKNKGKGSRPPKEKPSFAEALNRPRRGPAIAPGQLAVICDNMLQGLGRYLRACGIDVKILENEEEHEAAIEISRLEGRAVLTAGTPYQMMKSRVEEGQIMCVRADKKARYQVQDVLDFFNVVVTPRDIFSRCQVCNGNTYVKVCNSDMRFLWHQKVAILAGGTHHAIVPDYDEDDDLEEDFDDVVGLGNAYDDGTDVVLARPVQPSSTYMAACHSQVNPAANRAQSSPHPGAPSQTSTTLNEPRLEGYSQGGVGPQGDRSGPVTPQSTDDSTFDPLAVCTSGEQVKGVMSRPQRWRNANKSSACVEDDAPMLYLEDSIDFRSVSVVNPSGHTVDIQVDAVPEGILDQVTEFFCCAACGKVYWEGKHFKEVCSQFGVVLERGDDK